MGSFCTFRSASNHSDHLALFFIILSPENLVDRDLNLHSNPGLESASLLLDPWPPASATSHPCRPWHLSQWAVTFSIHSSLSSLAFPLIQSLFLPGLEIVLSLGIAPTQQIIFWPSSLFPLIFPQHRIPKFRRRCHLFESLREIWNCFCSLSPPLLP